MKQSMLLLRSLVLIILVVLKIPIVVNGVLKGDYAEDFVSSCYCLDIPGFVEVDWENTFDNLDCVYSNGFVFDSQF